MVVDRGAQRRSGNIRLWNVWKCVMSGKIFCRARCPYRVGEKRKMVIANLQIICRGRCLHRPVAVCPIYNPWKNAMTLGQRAHNVHPYGLYGENACFNMFWAYFVYPFAIQSLFLFLYSIILKFFRRSLFFKKGWKALVNNHFAGQRLSAGIMAQRAAESFSVIFMWRQLGR